MTGTIPAVPSTRQRLHGWLWLAAAALLSLPALAMRFFPEAGVDWDGRDFAVMGVMLAVGCGLCELATRLSANWAYRAAFALAVLTGFLTVWVNLAVGMLGNEGHPANLMFAGVLLVAGAGALVARFRAQGMARAMAAAGLAQLLAVAIAVPMGFSPLELLLTAGFALPWFVSALLFHVTTQRRVAGR